MDKTLAEIVDFEEIKKRLKHQKHRSVVERTIEIVVPSEEVMAFSVQTLLNKRNYHKYTQFKDEEMVKFCYEHLIPVHHLEPGMLPVLYYLNRLFRQGDRSEELIEEEGIFHSYHVITMESCSGHLRDEVSAGRSTGGFKLPFINFYKSTPASITNKYHDFANLIIQWKIFDFSYRDYPAARMFPHKKELENENAFITGVREFWNTLINVINYFNMQQSLNPDIVKEVIRPSEEITDYTLWL
jgi:hypothetical protein